MAKKLSIKKPALKKISIQRPTRQTFTSTKFIATTLILVSLVLLGGSAYVWYNRIFSDTDRVFYGMLSRSLETDSITRTVTQKDSSRTANQTYYIAFSPQTTMESTTVVEQVGQDRQTSSVTTKTIGQKNADYVQYSKISIPQSQSGGSDFSKVLNQWAKRENNPEKGEQAQFLDEAIFTFIPFGNFSQENRADLIEMIKQKNVYTLSNSQISYQEGRPVMQMTVSIKPKALIEVLRQYAEYSGIGDQSLLNPADYEKAANIGVDVKIDMLSRHLTQLDFPGQTRSETYTAYGLNRNIEIPTKTQTIPELQSKLMGQ